MSLKYGFLGLLASCVCLFTFLKSYEVWTHPLDQLSENVVEKKPEGKPKIAEPMEDRKDTNSIQSYVLISGKNIFSPDRKDFPIIPLEQSKSKIRPQVILYGVTIATDYESATVSNPGRPIRKEERGTLTIKVGEKVGEYKVAKILYDRITLEANGDSFHVLLYDPKIPKRRTGVETEIKPATATSAQPVPADPASGSPGPAPPITSEGPAKPVPPKETVVSSPPVAGPPVRPWPSRSDIIRARRVYLQTLTPAEGTGGK